MRKISTSNTSFICHSGGGGARAFEVRVRRSPFTSFICHSGGGGARAFEVRVKTIGACESHVRLRLLRERGGEEGRMIDG